MRIDRRAPRRVQNGDRPFLGGREDRRADQRALLLRIGIGAAGAGLLDARLDLAVGEAGQRAALGLDALETAAEKFEKWDPARPRNPAAPTTAATAAAAPTAAAIAAATAAEMAADEDLDPEPAEKSKT